MADPKDPTILTEDDFADEPPVLTDADFADAAPAGAPLGEGPILSQFRAPGAFPWKLPTDEQLAHRTRVLAEIGIPVAAGIMLGPQAGLAARAGIMGLAGGGANTLGLAIEPPKSTEEALWRVGSGAVLGAGGELAPTAAVSGARWLAPKATARAEDWGSRALGFMLSHLNRAGRDEARRAARVSLDERVIRPWAHPESTLARAEAVQDAAGRELGNIRTQVDAASPGAPTREILDELRLFLGEDIVPGSSTEEAFRRHLSSATGDVAAYARQGAQGAPVKGPVGNQTMWEMTRPEMVESASFTPNLGPDQSAMYDILRGHVEEIASAIRSGQQVPRDVLESYATYAPELAQLFPDAMNASALAELKSVFARQAYRDSGRVAENLMGELAPRSEMARGAVQGAEDRLVQSARPDLAASFQRNKDVYGAMERLTNTNTGATEAAANRALGNNEIFNLHGQLAGLSRQGPLAQSAMALLANVLSKRGASAASVYADRTARMAASPEAQHALMQVIRLLQQSAAPPSEKGLGLAP